MNFQAAIFDLDDTLVEASSSWRSGFQKTLASLDHRLTEDEFDKLYRMTNQEIRDFFHEVYVSKEPFISFEAVMDNFISELEKQYSFDIQAKPHALEFVKTLYHLEIPAGIATLAPRTFAEPALARLGFLPYLKFIITGDEVGASKEFADIYLTAAEKLGFPPSETVVFEDCLTAARTAYKAGFMVCGVADQFQNRTLEEFYPYCHWCITNYKDACRDCPGRNF